jgi:hypothetical protein
MPEKLTIENHRNCPSCGSPNTTIIVDHGRCLCGGDCWSHPECLDCGYMGYMNSDGIFWNWKGTPAEPKEQLENGNGTNK